MFNPRVPARPRWWLVLAILCAWPVGGLFAGEAADATKDGKSKDVTQTVLDKITPLNSFDLEGSFVAQGRFRIKRFDGDGPSTQRDYRSISETQLSTQYGHRFHLFDKVYLKLAVSYERFDFSTTDAPLPSSLQSLGGVVALEYVVRGRTGAFLRVNPAIYYSDFDEVGPGNFNAPVSIGSILPLGKKFYLLLGVQVNILTKYPVFPILGLVWLISDHVRLEAVPPNPRLIWSYNDFFDFYIGGEVLGDTYKRDSNPDYRRQDQRFNGAIIDYSELRLGGGVSITPSKKLDVTLDIAGGWDYGQNFDYYRGVGSKQFITRGAPYGRVSFNLTF